MASSVSRRKKSPIKIGGKKAGWLRILGEELRRPRVGKPRESSKGKDPESSERPAEGNSCGLSADAGRCWRRRASRSADPGGGAALRRFPRPGEEAVCARLRSRGGNCTGTARSRCVWSSAASAATPLCTSHPLPPPPPSSPALCCRQPRQRESTVSASCLDGVTHPRREVIWMLPWTADTAAEEGAKSAGIDEEPNCPARRFFGGCLPPASWATGTI
ncbi:uncharacterized protein [Desmodus rotundus]|uniref:uncharacterized protein n=1 Tax=Desmodus rotundus TaxID=9430 RepID=UPI002381219D|nr:uncharacterized protein LOC128780761 [Desmodus rotundus]